MVYKMHSLKHPALLKVAEISKSMPRAKALHSTQDVPCFGEVRIKFIPVVDLQTFSDSPRLVQNTAIPIPILIPIPKAFLKLVKAAPLII